ncbi:hypothetical protein HGM15179_005553 [Zosterops borbonicus]|uniref:Uncharacterized protein n=1 Tax=Zosterops borbonicus TaxID=364589 RepID=A0A8K1LQ08_9PASS|nr:hypothetical protein HGM15179_005553 [Zosterops borbonicus]
MEPNILEPVAGAWFVMLLARSGGLQELTLLPLCLSGSCNNNRALLRILEQERRRRQAVPEEKYPLSEKTPLFARPYKTHKEDWLSRRIKNLLGDWDSKVLLSRESPLIPVWIPEKPKSQSQASSHRLASRVTNPYQDTERESSAQPRDLTAHPKQNYVGSEEGCSNQRSEGTAPQSKILPEPVKPILYVYVQSIEGILKEMCSPLPPLLSPLQSPPRTETSKRPLQAKREPSTCKTWHLEHLVTQTKRGAVPREGPRETAFRNGREEGEKQEPGISSNSSQQHSKAREPPHKSYGQVAKTSQKICHERAKDSEKSSGKRAEISLKSCIQMAKDFPKSSSQMAKESKKSSGQVIKDLHKNFGIS